MQKLVLSRKGLDSSKVGGGYPSPIFSDNAMYSLPIPNDANSRRRNRAASGASRITYGDLHHATVDTGRLVANLTSRYGANSGIHLDPDIRPDAYQREGGWRPLFGQAGAAQGVLKNEGVGPGDLFLFFGLFQRVKENGSGGWRYDLRAPWLHVLWGWLQIAEVLKPLNIKNDQKYQWTRYHDHVKYADGYARDARTANNTLYVASEQMDLGNGIIVPGAGVFPKYHDNLVLTKFGQSRVSYWQLPKWFYPFFKGRERKPLKYFPQQKHWTPGTRHAYAYRTGPGQEFVLDCTQYHEAKDWLRDLFTVTLPRGTRA